MYGLPSIRLNLKTLRNAAFAFNGLLILLTFAVIFLCGRLGIHSSEDVTAYRTLIQGHYHPVWKDLAWRRIRKGDSVETILQKHPPLRREDFPPYVALRYHEISSSDRLVIQAKDGRLISAGAGHSTWTHFFFDSREEEEAFDKAYSAYAQQRLLESQALKIHLAIQGGQDVFLARLINSHGGEYREDEVLRELREIYGEDWLYAAGLGRRELTVEVTTVLHGGLQVGAVLTLPADNYWLPRQASRSPCSCTLTTCGFSTPKTRLAKAT